MTIDKFIIENHLVLTPEELAACQAGLKIMSESVDPFHNQYHIFRILADLNQFIKSDSTINWSNVNLPVLLVAICWHDTWQSKRHPKGRRSGYYQRFIEGIGSMRLFESYSQNRNLDRKLVKSVKYTIRKHSIFQLFPRFTQESLILVDLDKLEGWSLDRLRQALNTSGTLLEVTPKIIKIYRLYLRLWMFRSWGNKYRYSWCKQQYLLRRQAFIDEVGNIFREIGKGILKPDQQLHLASKTKTVTNYPKTSKSS